MTLREHAKHQEDQIRFLLKQMSMGMVELDAEHDDGRITSFYIDYDEQDMFNAATILYHVCGNYAIKHGLLTPENTTDKIDKFREMLKETFGLDTIEEAEKMCLLSELERNGGTA